ncbi:MAG: hypothetical protein CSA33_08585 [Desulfobulbus propionicus]|nr:MAG: hypothetical protein CSA33_08585 [Desulfobulbus propionicus]
MRGKDTTSQEPEVPERIGLFLKEKREEQGLSYEQVFADTRISKSNLKAIETHDYARLPANTFARGQLAIYADYLGLDGAKVAATFLQARNAQGKKLGQSPSNCFGDAKTLSVKRLAEPNHIRSSTVAIILFVLIALSLATFCLYTGWNPFACIPEKTRALSTTIPEAHPPFQKPKPEIIEADFLQLEALFHKDTTIHVSIDSSTPSKEIYGQGAHATWQADQEMRITFPQPDCAELKLNGSPHLFPRKQNSAYLLHVQVFSPE